MDLSLARAHKDALHNLTKSTIKSDLLANMFFHRGDFELPGRLYLNPLDCGGHSNGLARAYITYLVQRLFSITRYPGFHEKISSTNHREVVKFIGQLEDREIDAHLEELKELYRYTTKTIKEAIGSEHILLYRGVKNPMATTIASAVKYAKAIENGIHKYIFQCFRLLRSGPRWRA